MQWITQSACQKEEQNRKGTAMEKAKNHWFKELEENVIAVGIIIMFIMEQSMLSANSLLRAGWAFRKKSQSLPISGYVSSVQAIVQREVPISSLTH